MKGKIKRLIRSSAKHGYQCVNVGSLPHITGSKFLKGSHHIHAWCFKQDENTFPKIGGWSAIWNLTEQLGWGGCGNSHQRQVSYDHDGQLEQGAGVYIILNKIPNIKKDYSKEIKILNNISLAKYHRSKSVGKEAINLFDGIIINNIDKFDSKLTNNLFKKLIQDCILNPKERNSGWKVFYNNKFYSFPDLGMFFSYEKPLKKFPLSIK